MRKSTNSKLKLNSIRPMARNNPTLRLVLLLFLLAFAGCHGHETGVQNCKKLSRGMFVFGTSVVDNGNNNNILGSLSKANFPPYGIDFFLGPTGRFSNGNNVADVIATLLGLPLLPPFAETNSREIVHGVNYGSGGSGILDVTGSVTGGVITLTQQIKNFEDVTLPELKATLQGKPEQLLDGYVFLVAAGNNDFLLNYFLQDSSSRPALPIFVANLISTYATHLQRLYNVGAMKFALLTVYPLGCSPVVKATSKSQGCFETVNSATNYFNTQLINMVDSLKQKLPGSQFIIVNTYNIIRDIIQNPSASGFTNATGPCCELNSMGVSCLEGGKVCRERNKYVYFDGQHNTEGVNKIIASKAFFSNNISEVYPFNLQRLALL